MRYSLLIWIFLSGCIGMNSTRRLTKDVKQNFTYRFEGKNTGLSAKININGYYRYWFTDEFGTYKKIHGATDTLFLDILFYEDGTFVRNFWPSAGYTNYEDYFASVINKGSKDIFYRNHWWGIYTVSSDTIKTQYLMEAARLTPWYSGEEWYLIKGRNSVQFIFFKLDIKQVDEEMKLKNDAYVKSATLATFHPVVNVPPPYSWMKRNKFFWRNEVDWNLYMKSISE